VAIDGQWPFVVAPYFWFSGLKGDVSVKGLPQVPVDKSFSDIWNDFHFGALGHFEGRKDRWGFATDLMYLDLHAPVAANAPVVGRRGSASTASRRAAGKTTPRSSTPSAACASVRPSARAPR